SEQWPTVPPAPRPSGGRVLVANMHGLLFHEDLADLVENVRYARWLGATTVRAFATDNNTWQLWSGREVAAQIARLAPELRAQNVGLVVALVNNHRPVPGEASGSSGWLDDYYQLLLPFYSETWRGAYLTFLRELIGAVREAGATDVITAWEIGNELHTPQDPARVVPFITQAVAEIRAIDPLTPIWPGTMGANHLQPGTPNSPIARWLYCEAPVDAYTLHAYDWVGPYRSGDMPIEWDLESITGERCASGRRLPVIVEELGTSRELSGAYSSLDEPTRLSFELRQLRRALSYPQVAGIGVWNAESPRTRDRAFFDSRRGLTSYGTRAQGGGSCYDPRPDPAPGVRCTLEEVLRALDAIWPDPRVAPWRPRQEADPAAVVGAIDAPSVDGVLSGWVVDTRQPDGPGIDSVTVYAGPPGQGASPLGRGERLQRRPEVELALGNPAWSDAGFQLSLPVESLAAGVVHLTLEARAADGSTWWREMALITSGAARPMPPPAQPLAIATPTPLLAVLAAPPRLEVLSPVPGARVRSGQIVEGRAVDEAGGLDQVDVFLEPGRDGGGRLLTSADFDAPDQPGFSFVLRAPPGAHTLHLHVRSRVTGRETVVQLPLQVF
ncbi:MAG: hypothetical protein M3336_18135, partial [Chloroflexota bacterium]|nr:hypothetical protein [Chloroflexota bacterium]